MTEHRVHQQLIIPSLPSGKCEGPRAADPFRFRRFALSSVETPGGSALKIILSQIPLRQSAQNRPRIFRARTMRRCAAESYTRETMRIIR